MVPTAIVPINGLTESADVLAIGRAIARGFGVRLVLLHAVEPGTTRARSRAHRAGSLNVETLARQLRQDGINAEAQFRSAQLTRAIVSAATDYCAGVIV